jgi:ATP-dependent helicase/nuclease subunit B
VALLERLAASRKAELFGAKGAAEWARAFSGALAAAGFPGERTLDSHEHQALAKWHELLGEAASLERVSGRCAYREARERLARMARATIFQPQSPDVPIHVMGVLESAGIDFDHLWVTGLNDEAWPLPRRPNPFVPIAAQRAAGIPQADPAASIALDRRITDGWRGAAGEVVFSHFRTQGETELVPSPLVAQIPAADFAALGIAAYPAARDAIRAAGAIERLDDASGPAPAEGVRSGGTRLFRDQAACAFRGFARHRLASEPLEAPQHGLNARDRGSLVHCMLAAAWKALQSHARLVAMPAAELEVVLAAAADEAIASVRRYRSDALAGRFGELERERLVRLGREWLALEARRDPFEVAAMEQKQEMSFGGTRVNVKLDRMDRLEAGGDAVIDYKTGPCATRDWMGARPEEPQLPMYALARGASVAAVAFAQVKAGDICFRGIARAPNLIPRVNVIADDRSPRARQYRDWDALLAAWRAELEAIGRGFASGDARVDPKDGKSTCDTCDQQMLCRIAEKAPFGAVGGGEREE